jgi:hypothetical protein
MLIVDARQRLGDVFVNASWAIRSVFGWIGRGFS